MSATLSMSSRQWEPSIGTDLPHPVGVGIGADARQLGRQDVQVGLGALGVVPHQQLVVADHGGVLLGARPQRHAPRVGDRLALAVAAPAPVVERAGDLVALDRALGEVAAHVPAVAVEHVELALAVLPDDELAAEALDGVRLAVAEAVGQARGSATRARSARRDSLVQGPRIAGVSLMTYLSSAECLLRPRLAENENTF